MIRVWRVDPLVEDLRTGAVSERDKLHYVLFSVVLHYLVGPASLLSSPSWSTLGWNTVATIIAFVGISLVFAANQGDAGQSFIERYFCLSLPITVRTYLVGYLIYYVIFIIVLALWPGYKEQESIQRLVSVMFGMILVVVYIGWLCRAMKRVAVTKSA